MFIFKKRVGYFLFFHLRNCQMETECSHITHNVGRIGDVADAQMFIGIQMFKIITNA